MSNINKTDTKKSVSNTKKQKDSSKENDELVTEFIKEFEKVRNEIKFTPTFEQLDEIFYLKDMIRERGFVSSVPSRQICGRMCENFAKWNEFFHRLLVPSPNSLVAIEESKILTDDDRNKLSVIFYKVMEFLSRNAVIGIEKDRLAEAKLINEMFAYYNEKLSPEALRIEKILNEMWKIKVDPKKAKPSYSG